MWHVIECPERFGNLLGVLYAQARLWIMYKNNDLEWFSLYHWLVRASGAIT